MYFEDKTFIRKDEATLFQSLRHKNSFLLLGPRQTGKSTLIESLFNQIPPTDQLKYYFQLPRTREVFEEDPETLLREIEALHSKDPVFVFIDEIQKIPKILDVLQFLIDKKKIILAACGSSARQMRKFKANWLPGRIRLHHLFPLTHSEIIQSQVKTNLEELLIFGGLPGILREKNIDERKESLNSYTHLYLEEEIRAEAVTRNLPRFTKFLRTAALESGTSPNFSKMAQQVGTSHTTIKEYYQILIDTLIVHELKAFGTKRDNVLKSSRYYFFDIGVRNAAAQLPLEKGLLKLQIGPLFEHFIYLELLAHFYKTFNFSYYRTKSGAEVDLIIDTGKKRIALEIKATKKPSLKDFKGLHYFSEKQKCDETILVCQVGNRQKFNNHLALSWKDIVDYLHS